MTREDVDKLEAIRETDALVAGFLGWRWIKITDAAEPMFTDPKLLSLCRPDYIEGHSVMHDGPIPDTVPRFSSDIAATFEMEAEIERRGLKEEYGKALGKIVLGWRYDAGKLVSDAEIFALAHASPLERCKAAALLAASEER